MLLFLESILHCCGSFVFPSICWSAKAAISLRPPAELAMTGQNAGPTAWGLMWHIHVLGKKWWTHWQMQMLLKCVALGRDRMNKWAHKESYNRKDVFRTVCSLNKMFKVNQASSYETSRYFTQNMSWLHGFAFCLIRVECCEKVLGKKNKMIPCRQ